MYALGSADSRNVKKVASERRETAVSVGILQVLAAERTLVGPEIEE